MSSTSKVALQFAHLNLSWGRAGALSRLPRRQRVETSRSPVISRLLAAQRCGPARRDRAHDAPLDITEVVAMGLPKRLAVAAENVRRLDPRVHDAGSGGRHDLHPKPVERARRLADGLGRDPGIARRALQIGVTEWS